MLGVARIGDIAGGAIINGANTVLTNGIPTAQLGSAVTGHGKPPHASSVIIGSSSSVFVEGIPIARFGDAATCGHVITNASPNVNAG